MKISVESTEIWCVHKEVDLVVAAKTKLAQCKVSDREKLEFHMECIKFLAAMSGKILERSPLKYSLMRFASCLAPASVVKSGTIEEQNFAGLVETVQVEQHWCCSRRCCQSTICGTLQTSIYGNEEFI